MGLTFGHQSSSSHAPASRDLGFRRAFSNFSNFAVPYFDEVSTDVALTGTVAGGGLSLAGYPEFGIPIALGANAFAFGVDLTTGTITLVNLSLNPSLPNLTTFALHGTAVGLDVISAPVLEKLGMPLVIRELKMEFPKLAPILLPAH